MWVQTSYGFYSAVAHRDEPDTIIVRARSRGDLVNLRKRSNKALKGREIERTFSADYPYRMYIPRKVWAKVLHDAAMAIDYDNVKNSLEGPDRIQRHNTLLRVWSILHEIEYEPTAKVHRRPAPLPYEAGMPSERNQANLPYSSGSYDSWFGGGVNRRAGDSRYEDRATGNTLARLGKRWEGVSTDPRLDEPTLEELRAIYTSEPYPDPLEQNDAL